MYEKLGGGDGSKAQAWGKNHNLDLTLDLALSGGTDDKKQDDFIQDKDLLHQHRLAQVDLQTGNMEAHMLRHKGDLKFAAGLAMLPGAYGAAGKNGALRAFMNNLDVAAASNKHGLQLLQHLARFQLGIENASDQWKFYQVMSDPEWTVHEIMRAYVSAVRAEHHNRRDPPLTIFTDIFNMRRDLEIKQEETRAQESATFWRLTADALFF